MPHKTKPTIVNRRRFLAQSAVAIAATPLAPVLANASYKIENLVQRPHHDLFNETGWAEGGTQSMIAHFPPRCSPFAGDLGNSCVIQEETMIGPCYFDNIHTEDDISEGQPGVPMALVLRLTDAACLPIEGANIEVWWANVHGIYSGDSSGSTNGVATQKEVDDLLNSAESPADFPANPDGGPPKFFAPLCYFEKGQADPEEAARSKYFRGEKQLI